MSLFSGLAALDHSKALVHIVGLIPFAYILCWVVYSRLFHPLAKVPGPLWPSISRTWLMWRMYLGDLEHHMRTIHESKRFLFNQKLDHYQYGTLVRTAPDEVHASDPAEIPKIYPIHQPLQKTDWYLSYRAMGLGNIADSFTDDDEKHHSAHLRTIGQVYTLSNMLKNEGAIDKTTSLFIQRLGEFADLGRHFDYGLWLEMYSFDNVGVAFFGKAFGFIEESIDYGGYIHAVHTAMPLNSVIAMAPWWSRRFLMVTGIMIPKVFKAIIATDSFRVTAVRETSLALARTLGATSSRNDILSQLLSIMHEHKDDLTIQDIHVQMWQAIVAGADSTSGALRAIFYFLMKNPQKLAKLVREIDVAFENGTFTHPVQYNQAMKVLYLKAVIQESLRIFPPFGAPMPRYTSSLGMEISGFKLPPGTKVGMSATVTQYDKVLFGEDAYEFRPERWLESEERYRAMEKAMLVFGAGTRTCLGKHLSIAEMYKVVPEILRLYTIEMAHDRPWKTVNATFVLQSHVICNIKRRGS